MSSLTGHLLQMLETVAEALGTDLRERMVFVGGCTTALFITDAVTLEDVRATDDVDLIVDLAGYAEWTQLQEQLRSRGFSESPDDDVLCRMRLGGLKVDFMPDDARILGFTNRWYERGIATPVTHFLASGRRIRHLSPALFLATKLEAYRGRGDADLITSRDMEDILLVVDGRETLTDEIRNAGDDIRGYVANEFRDISNDRAFDDFIAGNIRGPEGRVEIVRKRFAAISAL